MRPIAVLLGVLGALGCSSGPDIPEDTAYSLAGVGGVCPARSAATSACPTLVCDRGSSAGAGRFVAIESCAPGFDARRCGAMQNAGQHPAFDTCRQGTTMPVWLLRDVDVAAAVRRCSEPIVDGGSRPEWCPP